MRGRELKHGTSAAVKRWATSPLMRGRELKQVEDDIIANYEDASPLMRGRELKRWKNSCSTAKIFVAPYAGA